MDDLKGLPCMDTKDIKVPGKHLTIGEPLGNGLLFTLWPILISEVAFVRLDETLNLLKAAMPGLQERYAVKHLSVFGSVARGEAGMNSDVDLLIEFEPGRAGGYFKFFTLQMELEKLLHQRVDLVTPDALKRQMKDRILAEAIHAA